MTTLFLLKLLLKLRAVVTRLADHAEDARAQQPQGLALVDPHPRLPEDPTKHEGLHTAQRPRHLPAPPAPRGGAWPSPGRCPPRGRRVPRARRGSAPPVLHIHLLLRDPRPKDRLGKITLFHPTVAGDDDVRRGRGYGDLQILMSQGGNPWIFRGSSLRI